MKISIICMLCVLVNIAHAAPTYRTIRAAVVDNASRSTLYRSQVPLTVADYVRNEIAAGRRPTAIAWGAGAPINTLGVGNVYVYRNEAAYVKHRDDRIRPALDSWVATTDLGSGNRSRAGAAFVFANISENNGVMLGDLYRWQGSVTFAQSGGSSFNEITFAASRAVPVNARPIEAAMRLDSAVLAYYGASYDSTDFNGNGTIALLARSDAFVVPLTPRIPVGALSLTKPIQRDDADIAVEATAMNDLWSSLSIQVRYVNRGTVVRPNFVIGTSLGAAKPGWGSEIVSGSHPTVPPAAIVPAGDPMQVHQYCLFARSVADSMWYFLDYETLTPYGHLADFRVTTTDTVTTTGLLRRTRRDVVNSIRVAFDLRNTTTEQRILVATGTVGAQQEDLEVEIRADVTNERPFAVPVPRDIWLGSNPATRSYDLRSTRSPFQKGNYSFQVSPSTFIGTVSANPTVATGAKIYTLTPWSLPILFAGSGVFNALQLSESYVLEVHPTLEWSVLDGILDVASGTQYTGSGGQGGTTSLGRVEFTGDIQVQIRARYPRSRVIMVITDPNNRSTLIADEDTRGSDDTAPLLIAGSPFPALGGNGRYTLHLLEQTPIDTAAWSTMGVPGLAEPDRRAGYGWVSAQQIQFDYTGAIRVNGMIISAEH